MKRTIGAGIVLAFVVVACGVLVWAEPASGVTPKVLARGLYEPFKVKTEPESLIDFEAKAKSHVDVVVRQHDYIAGSSTGWHTHPGPVFITVTQGQLTFYELDDPTCTPHVVSANPAAGTNFGGGYVDNGHGHIARNESGLPAQDVSVILAPVGQPFRTDLPAHANPSCGF